MTISFTFMPGAGADLVPSVDRPSFFFDPATARKGLVAARNAGFQRVVIDDASGLLYNFYLAVAAASFSPQLEVVLTHWAGVMTPEIAAHQVAALDLKCGGQFALRLLVDEAPRGDDDTMVQAGHAASWQRTDEYLTLLKRLWSNERPFDHEGRFYSIRQGFIARKSPRGHSIPIRMSGRSGTAIQVAARHADVFELPSGTPGEILSLTERIRSAAAQYGRGNKIRFALPIRVCEACEGRPTGTDGLAVVNASAAAAAALRPYIQAGVSEFMVVGADNAEVLRRFGREVVSVVCGVMARNETAVARFQPRRAKPHSHRPHLWVV